MSSLLGVGELPHLCSRLTDSCATSTPPQRSQLLQASACPWLQDQACLSPPVLAQMTRAAMASVGVSPLLKYFLFIVLVVPGLRWGMRDVQSSSWHAGSFQLWPVGSRASLGLSGIESACPCGRPGFNSCVGKIPWMRKWQPTPVFLPGKSHGQKNLKGYSPQGCKRVRHNLATQQQHAGSSSLTKD